jgi:phytol kinase
MNNIIGIIVSFVFVFAVIGLSTVLSNKGLLDGEGSRKFIHIAVSNWWIIAMFTFDDPLWASFVPLMFVFINYISYRKNVFKAMERDGSSRDLGTVYYAISLLILAYVSFAYKVPYLGGIGILVMGYGDGFAALIGTKFGKHSFEKYGLSKSLEGSITVFIFALLISGIFFGIYSSNLWMIKSLVVAVSATIIELLSPNGFDNLSLPLLVSLLSWALVSTL